MTPPAPLHRGPATPDTHPRWDGHARGDLFYLPRLDAVLTVEHRTGAGYRCAVVASHRPRPETRHVLLPPTEIAATATTVTVDPDDPDAAAMAWLAEVWRRWRGGPTYLGARTLAEDLRIPGTLVADLDPPARTRLAAVTRLRAPGIDRLLDRLTAAGLLQRAQPDRDHGWGVYTLRLPALTEAAPPLPTVQP